MKTVTEVKATRKIGPNVKSCLLLLLVTLASLSLLSVHSAQASKPVANVSLQAVGPIGAWVGGILYNDGSATGGGSICGIDFTGDGVPDTMQIIPIAGSWNPGTGPGTGVLVLWGLLVDPQTGASIGPVPVVLTGLSEGFNDIVFEGVRHILVIHSVP